MKTNEEQKAECIEYLEDLIQNIKNDKTSDNYCFNWEVLEQKEDNYHVERFVRYSITINEYIEKQVKSEH